MQPELPERVEVEWLDSESDGEWRSLRSALREADEEDMLHRSCGYLLADTDGYVLLALNYRPGGEGLSEMVADTIRIPRATVVGVHRLRIVRSR